ncbi:hypothetical protein PRUPE_4G278900 [Prunus persica]|uniref:Leucine-rich repeat-containing N-terminal plant-type domain-containing protein n=1 Tax=Prunus persica TaxID=3760 RepID=M5WR75_PRUPE|nr:hypothetical protein PRUPE_4G278900 [Prunus persica]
MLKYKERKINLSVLGWLDLSPNKLVGEIAWELAYLTWLEKFNVSKNRLAGFIPQGKQFGTFKNDSYSGK